MRGTSRGINIIRLKAITASTVSVVVSFGISMLPARRPLVFPRALARTPAFGDALVAPREQHDHAERELNGWIDRALGGADRAGTLERADAHQTERDGDHQRTEPISSISRFGFATSIIPVEARRAPGFGGRRREKRTT